MAEAFGIACSIEDGRPVVRGVSKSGERTEQQFRYAAHKADDWPLQLIGIYNAVTTELSGREIVAVVVRGMDYSGRRGLTSSTAKRIGADAVVVAAARQMVNTVAVMTGKEAGDALQTSKEEVEAAAAELGVDGVFVVAAAAALAAETLVR